MANRFASGKWAIAECDRCGQQYKLKKLKTEIIKQRRYELLVCPTCWDPDQPQLMLGTFPVDDPQALRVSRRDTTYYTSGLLADGSQGGGSRQIQWGWNPVGMAQGFDSELTPNDLVGVGQIGTVGFSLGCGVSVSGVAGTTALGTVIKRDDVNVTLTGTEGTGETDDVTVELVTYVEAGSLSADSLVGTVSVTT